MYTHSSQTRTTRSDPSIEFVNWYKDALQSMAAYVREQDPDFIVALTRSGPQLVELMENVGLGFDDDVHVLSEKSLAFIPQTQLQGQDIVLLDDVMKTGETVQTLTTKLESEYGASVDPVTLVTDADAAHHEDVNYQLELNKAKRFQFTSNLAQSFRYLNKPYDVDHAIFCTSPGVESLPNLDALDDAYNLTTVAQRQSDFSRYSIVPGGQNRPYVTDQVLINGFADTKIEKLRTYLDHQTGEFVFTPISIFSVRKQDTTNIAVFENPFECLNVLVDDARNYITDDDPELAYYRLIWYLVSYLNGLAYRETYFSDELNLLEHGPDNHLRFVDLNYLFGPDFANRIQSYLHDHYPELVAGVADVSVQLSDDGPTQIGYADPNHPVQFDDDQQDLYNEIDSFIQANVDPAEPLSDNLATIFESIELAAERVRGVGFNYYQLRQILENNGVDVTSDGGQVALSLAFDFLVDAGVQIPIFNERSDRFERAYRHGEGVLNQRLYAYLIDAVTDNLFSHVESEWDSHFPRIGFEKTGMLLSDKLHKADLWKSQTANKLHSRLSDPPILPGKNKEIDVGPSMYRHGRIQLVEEVGSGTENLFSEWCVRKGIAAYADTGGLRNSQEWKQSHQIDSAKKLVDSSSIGEFSNLAIVAATIYEEIGEDHLIAITTCRSDYAAHCAMRELLKLFFRDPAFTVAEALDDLSDMIERFESNEQLVALTAENPIVDELEDGRSQILAAKSAAAGIEHKHRLWDNLNQYVAEIEDWFEDDGLMTNIYQSSIESYLDNITDVEQTGGYQPSGLAERTLELGEASERFAALFGALVDLSLAIIAKERHPGPELDEFYTQQARWNSYAKSARSDGQHLDDLPTFDLGVTSVPAIPKRDLSPEVLADDRRHGITLLADLFPQMKSIYRNLDAAYSERFTQSEWDKMMEWFYPEQSSDDSTTGDELRWVVWHDTKGSTELARKGRKSAVRAAVTNAIETVITDPEDGHFQETQDDQTFVFTKDLSTAVDVLDAILEASDDCSAYQRATLASVPTGDVTVDPTEEQISSQMAHVRAVRIGGYPESKGYATEDAHTLALDGTARDRVGAFEGTLPSSWNIKGIEKEQAYLDDIDGRTTISIHELTRDSGIDT
ncbi:phosphoribosyltransferase [Haloarcula sp. KBTZ06]|uniref:phosphoribosyltransferase n=1 Tax=Haloarcula sp. KBTZ06 TaxID=3402682 RepID=UPI003B437AC7